MRDPHPRQHHAVRGVVVSQVGMEHFSVNLRYVFRGAETAETNCVLLVSSLTTEVGETASQGAHTPAFPRTAPLPPSLPEKPTTAPSSYNRAVTASCVIKR